MKAVIWTDALQTFAMAAGALAAAIKTISIIGGFDKAIAAAEKGGRINYWKYVLTDCIYWIFGNLALK